MHKTMVNWQIQQDLIEPKDVETDLDWQYKKYKSATVKMNYNAKTTETIKANKNNKEMLNEKENNTCE